MFGKRSKPSQCKIGRPCGLGCVSKDHNCRGVLKGAAKVVVQWLTKVTGNVVKQAKSRFNRPRTKPTKPVVKRERGVFVPDQEKLNRLAKDRENLKQKGLLTEEAIRGFEQAESMLKGQVPINKERLRKNENELQLRRDTTEQDLSKEKEDAYIDQARKILDSDDTQIFIAINDRWTESVLKTGLRNGIEMTDSGAYNSIESIGDYITQRKEIEEGVMGVNNNNHFPNYARPNYGYIASRTDITNDRNITSHDITDLYGDVKIELHTDIKNRSSFTKGDSMDEDDIHAAVPYHSKSIVPWVYNNFSSRTPIDVPPSEVSDLKKGVDYLEAQIYGGVTAKDIKAIHYRENKPLNSIVKLANSYGIEIYFKGKKYGN